MKILKCFKRYILYRYKEISWVDNRLESWSVRNVIFFFKKKMMSLISIDKMKRSISNKKLS